MTERLVGRALAALVLAVAWPVVWLVERWDRPD